MSAIGYKLKSHSLELYGCNGGALTLNFAERVEHPVLLFQDALRTLGVSRHFSEDGLPLEIQLDSINRARMVKVGENNVVYGRKDGSMALPDLKLTYYPHNDSLRISAYNSSLLEALKRLNKDSQADIVQEQQPIKG